MLDGCCGNWLTEWIDYGLTAELAGTLLES